MAFEKKFQLTGHDPFDSLITRYADTEDAAQQELILADIWEQFGTTGTVLISDMASFSSTSRRSGICHYLKLIHRARRIIAPIIEANKGLLLKCDADNCYAFFEKTDDAIAASFAANAAIFDANQSFNEDEQIYLSVGIDRGRVLLVGKDDFFGDPVNTASKLGEDLAIKAETLVTDRALEESGYEIPAIAEHLVARISEIEIQYVRLPMISLLGNGAK